jgi:hypothetical protein
LPWGIPVVGWVPAYGIFESRHSARDGESHQPTGAC